LSLIVFLIRATGILRTFAMRATCIFAPAGDRSGSKPLPGIHKVKAVKKGAVRVSIDSPVRLDINQLEDIPVD